jgi:formylglycine-generating enzyme required for sulfatase activity
MQYPMKTSSIKKPKTNYATVFVAAAFTLGAATAPGAAVGTDYLTDPSLMVKVGYADNAADPATNNLYGAVSYDYYIGKYEVTNAQYVAFLNAVVGTGTDTYSLYNSTAGSSALGGITRNESTGVFGLKSAEWANKPVNYVSFWDAARFVNWLSTGDTENGVYTFGGVLNPVSSTITRNQTAWENGAFAIASEDEWYKAAYYNPTLDGGAGGYTNYPWAGGAEPVTDTDAVNGANFNGSWKVTDAGLYINATSYFGTYDQAGNVCEWNDTIPSGEYRLLRGGSSGSDAANKISAAAAGRTAASPGGDDGIRGFRIVSLTAAPAAVPAAVPEPGAWAAATGGAMRVFGMWVRRGRHGKRA